MSKLPILYSFRRCPYAMRARMALLKSQTPVRLREVVLRDKPEEMIDASPKATVPILVLDGGQVIDESMAIMHWALGRNDPENWLPISDTADELLAEADSNFKFHLDRYKYHTRYEVADPMEHRNEGEKFLGKLDRRLDDRGGQLDGKRAKLVDYAIFPFVRQFANHDRNYFDALDLPGLQKWLLGHIGSDIFEAAMVKHSPWRTKRQETLFGYARVY